MKLRKTLSSIVLATSAVLFGASANAEPITRDNFEDGIIDSSKFVVGGRRISWTPLDQGSWTAAQEEITDITDGYLRLRNHGPYTGNSYGSISWLRTAYNFNDGKNYTINFTWRADATNGDTHENMVRFRISNGYIPSFEEVNWQWPYFGEQNHGFKDLLWSFEGQNLSSHKRYEFDSEKQTWSVKIEKEGIARLFDEGNGRGNLLHEASLDSDQPWHFMVMCSDATSAGFGAGDFSLNLYDFNAVPEPSPLVLLAGAGLTLAGLYRFRKR